MITTDNAKKLVSENMETECIVITKPVAMENLCICEYESAKCTSFCQFSLECV